MICRLCITLTGIVLVAALAVYGHAATTSHSAQVQAPDTQLDSSLAQLYEMYTTIYSFEQRIEQTEAANGGRKPAQIEIVKGLEQKFVDHLPSSSNPPNSSRFLESQVANSDLIVMGVPLTARTLPIQDRSFLFTEYQVKVDRVLSADQHNILPGDVITVSRAGGELMVNGVMVKAIEPAFELFRLNQPHIFMLHSIPRTDSYRALGSGTFLIENDTVKIASHFEEGSEPKRDLNSFLSEVNAAAARKRSGRN